MRRRAPYIVLLLALLGASADPGARAQRPCADRTPHGAGHFGESRRRLRWDPAAKAAVETREGAHRPDAGSGEDIRLETLLVVMDVLVTDASGARAVAGLTADDFVVTEDGRPQTVAFVARGDALDRPRSIVLILDRSPSQALFLRTSLEAATSLVQQLGPRDEMAIVTDDVRLVVDFTCDRSALLAALEGLARDTGARDRGPVPRLPGKSLQFSALFATLRELVDEEQERPIVIFQTDGDEAASFPDQYERVDPAQQWPRREYGLGDIYRAAEASRATIYSVVTMERLAGLPPDEARARARRILERQLRERAASEERYRAYMKANPLSDSFLEAWTDLFSRGQAAAARVAELTGGAVAFLDAPERAAAIYREILADVGRRTLVGYYPTNAARDGRLRRVRVEVRGHPEYQVFGRTTYRAP